MIDLMAGLLSIPFEVHVMIVRRLSLKECVAYMQVCTVTHDAVCPQKGVRL